MVRTLMASAALLCATAAAVGADEPPAIEHQPSACTVPGKRISLCASVTDERQVASVRAYFKASGDRYYSYVDLAFGGLTYCGPLPAPRETARAVEYYVQAVDDQYQPQRTSTHVMQVQPEGVCEFPPVVKGDEAAAALTVHATNRKQGRKLSRAFDDAGVSFVGIAP
jgi:hypothetical protein